MAEKDKTIALVIDAIVIVRSSGRHRYHRVLDRGIETVWKPEVDESGKRRFEVVVKSRQLDVTLNGAFDRNTGQISIDTVNESPRSYLKKKRYRVSGYTVKANFSN